MRIFRFALGLLWITLTQRLVIIILLALAFLIFQFDLAKFFSPRDKQKNLAPSSRLVDDAAGEVARSIVLQCPKPENSYSQLLVLPVRNDRENAIENMIRKEFQEQQADSGWYKLVEKDTLTWALDQLQLRVIGKDAQKELSKDDAIRIGKAAGAELVLLSQVDRFVPGNGGHEISGMSQLINVATGEIFAFPFDNSDRRGMMLSVSGWRQYAVLVIFTLIWPILMIPVLRQVVARENNRDNFAGIMLMALVPLVIAVSMFGVQLLNAMTLIACSLFFALAAGWVGFVMNQLAEKMK